jgi:hypothetical protein
MSCVSSQLPSPLMGEVRVGVRLALFPPSPSSPAQGEGALTSPHEFKVVGERGYRVRKKPLRRPPAFENMGVAMANDAAPQAAAIRPPLLP